MTNIIETLEQTDLQTLYLSHAPQPAEMKQWLEQIVLAMEQYPQLEEVDLNTTLDMGPTSAHFSLRLRFTGIDISHHFAKVLGGKSPLVNYGTVETRMRYLVQNTGSAIFFALIPRTPTMVKVIRQTLYATGWQVLEDLSNRLSKLATRDEFFLDTSTGIMPDYWELSCEYRLNIFPRLFADIGPELSLGGNVPANKVPYYALREAQRLREGEYQKLPDHIVEQIDPLTYLLEAPHLGMKPSNQGKIAYTENKKKGANDTQSVMKPGKYLRRVMKDRITDDQHLKDLVAELNEACTIEVKTTFEPEQAKWVYMNGPDSCMSKGRERFNSTYDLNGNWRHPIEALFFPDGSGDIGLAYIMVGPRPAARALFSKQRDGFPRIYVADWAPGAGKRLHDWLIDEQDMREDEEALDGCHIPMIELRNGLYLCPYIDGDNRGVEFTGGDNMIVGGDCKADYADGYVDLDQRWGEPCDECGERYDEDDMTYVESTNQNVCESCLEDDFAEALDNDGDVMLYPTRDTYGIGFMHIIRTPFGATIRFDRVHDDISQDTLNDNGLCYVYNEPEDVYRLDECVKVEDTDEFVPCDDVASYLTDPADMSQDYVTLAYGDTHPLADCVWVTDEQEWVHNSDVDTNTHFLSGASNKRGHFYDMAEPIHEDQEDEVDAA